MRPGQQNKRMRGRGRKSPNPLSRSYESNGPDVKIRGNAQHIAEKYITLSRDASAAGDRVMAENYLQHAEHYGRIVAAAQGTFQFQRDENDGLDGEYEDGDDEGMQDGGAANGYPYPVPERAQGDRPQPPQMRDNRDQRDYQNNRDQPGREYQPRENQARDNQARDGQARDGQNRDYQNRDAQNRDPQGAREQRFNNNRDNGNRDTNGNRDGQNRNRDRNSGPRDGNRQWENRGEGRERQNWQDRQTPNGLGPQPVLPEASPVDAPAAVAHDREPVREERFAGQPQNDGAVENIATTRQESGFGQADASREALAVPEGSILPPDGETPVREVRRRGRPRRPRYGEGEAGRPDEVSAPGAGAGSEAGVSAPAVPETPVQDAAVEAPVKRKPGRPRKKKPEDEAGEGSGELPAFLLASNG